MISFWDFVEYFKLKKILMGMTVFGTFSSTLYFGYRYYLGYYTEIIFSNMKFKSTHILYKEY